MRAICWHNLVCCTTQPARMFVCLSGLVSWRLDHPPSHPLACCGNLQAPKGEAERRPIELFMCSIMLKMGYAEGFKWLGARI